MRKNKEEIVMVCSKCGDMPKGVKNGYWFEYPILCEKCGGSIEVKLKDGDDNAV